MTTATATPAPPADAIVPFGTRPEYWAGHRASPEQIAAWVEEFERDGYLFIPKVLPPDLCGRLRADLDSVLGKREGKGPHCELHHRLFETSRANLSLFDLEPIVTFAERSLATECHVIHNNSFMTFPGQGITMWHQDDPPHYLVTHGEAPTNIKLPTLFFTCNYYLTDVTEEIGGTETIPRSHLFGKACPTDLAGTPQEPLIRHNPGPMGSVVIFNNQVWHRGGPNRSQQTRYVTQITYGRRCIGHKYHPFMNYQMPEHVYRDASPRLKRLLGFLSSGAYG